MKTLPFLSMLISVLLLPHILQAGDPGGDFKTLEEAAYKLGETDEGKGYEKQFGKEFGASLQPALQACTEAAKTPYKVKLVYVISADGTLTRVVPDPEQPVSLCVAGKLKDAKFSPPPKAGWLVLVRVTIEE